MEKNTKGSINVQLICEICKIDFTSNADYALHEFSKKHCDNLIRIAKHKPVVNKQKIKSETPPVEKEPPKINTVTHSGSFAKYGYFVPGEIYKMAEVTKEFNTDYDPYLQKFAENPFKVKPTSEIPQVNGSQASPAIETGSVSFSNRKKKKKIKTCQICHVTLRTVPEYEAHMKSPKHIRELKITGMGVSAHFVKASTDLHTTDVNEESKSTDQTGEEMFLGQNLKESPDPFPLLYCQACKLLLNSPQQYNAHVAGKAHSECAQRKAELKAKKEKLLNPSSNQLYCYSCQISLNNLFQYNEHKNGKKHKTKCKQLIKKGITIPPEERVPGLDVPKFNSNKSVVYPELYKKFVLDKQKQEGVIEEPEKPAHSEAPIADILTGAYHCASCNLKFGTLCNYSSHIKSKEHNRISPSLSDVEWPNKNDSNQDVNEETGSDGFFKKPAIIFHSNTTKSISNQEASPDKRFADDQSVIHSTAASEKRPAWHEESAMETATNSVEESKKEKQVTIISGNAFLKCNICLRDFHWQSQFDVHLNSEDHVKKILELKSNKMTDGEILKIIFSDRTFVKPDNSGRLNCSICSVATENREEFDQHLKSVVHKYAEKDYKRKRTAEVKHVVGVDEHGLYFCKLCKEGWNSLMDFVHHLHFVKHRSIQSAERARKILARRRSLMAQKQRLVQSLKRKSILTKRLKGEKNPGVRTKICGVATDLCTGARAPVPNLEPLEPNIDSTKNVNIGASGNPNSKILKRRGIANRKTGRQNFTTQRIPPLIPPPCANIPPLFPAPPFQPPPFLMAPRTPRFMPSRSWSPYPRPYFSRPIYPGSPWLQRTPSPRYSFGNR